MFDRISEVLAATATKAKPPRKSQKGVPKNKHVPLPAGHRIAEWTLLEFIPGDVKSQYRAKYKCQCSCGVKRTISASNLVSGQTRSCGHKRSNNALF